MTDIEEIIRRAMEEGKFDDLPGKGKPLKLDENPHVDPAWRTAYHLLKSNGFSLPWIEKRQEIETRLEQARRDLARAAGQRRESLERQAAVAYYAGIWREAQQAFRAQVQEINKAIATYNLEAPSPTFQMRKVDAEREIAGASGQPG